MPKRYAQEFRRGVCERLLASEKTSSVPGCQARDLDPCRRNRALSAQPGHSPGNSRPPDA